MRHLKVVLIGVIVMIIGMHILMRKKLRQPFLLILAATWIRVKLTLRV